MPNELPLQPEWQSLIEKRAEAERRRQERRKQRAADASAAGEPAGEDRRVVADRRWRARRNRG